VYTKVIVTIPSACTTLEWSSKYRETESQDKPGASVWGNTIRFRAVLFVTFSYKEKVRRTINAGVECNAVEIDAHRGICRFRFFASHRMTGDRSCDPFRVENRFVRCGCYKDATPSESGWL
jgi:hypothetical protein